MNNKKGFTLIETVVALGILAISLTMAMALVVNVVFLALNARNTTAANALMQTRLNAAVSTLCTECGTNLNGLLALDDDGIRTIKTINGESSNAYESTKTIDGITYTGTIAVPVHPIPVYSTTGGKIISGANFRKVTSLIEWSYKGRTYKEQTIQYVKVIF